MKLNIKYLNSNLPKISSKDGDSGYDLRADIKEPLTVAPFGIATIPAGICVELTDYNTNDNSSVEIQIRPRSGLTAKGIVAQLGTVDVSYRGEIKINVFNFNNHEITIQPLDRIAQMVVCPIFKPQAVEVEELSETLRGENGFGSSGVK
ncbi:MAG: dUTP diphosphatase [Alphaproteobacteria bacterium]|nr:dUTP diphosphatase [Alphaproteobacteria bacterium]